MSSTPSRVTLLLEVVDAERHDRQAVDRAAGRFGVQPSAGAREDALVREQFDERFVDLFDPVVALLVVAVDGALDGRDARVGNIGAAGDVFFVPQQEVELMLLADGGEQAGVRVIGRRGVPAFDGRAVQRGDVWNQVVWVGQHDGIFQQRGATVGGRNVTILVQSRQDTLASITNREEIAESASQGDGGKP